MPSKVGVGDGKGVPLAVAVAVAVADGVPVAVAVGLPDGTGLADGVALGQVPSVTVSVSIYHPGAETASSVPIRKRSLIVCPLTFGPRFTTVLI